jgi:hypothetical protein
MAARIVISRGACSILLFRFPGLFFSQSAGAAVIERKDDAAGATCADLVRALERARTRFVVAIAAENKRTPRDRWRSYLETEQDIRRCVKRLRLHQRSGAPAGAEWPDALRSIRNLPVPAAKKQRNSEAQLLNQHLQNVLTRLRE